MLLLPSRGKERRVQGLLVKIVNSHCSELRNRIEGPRLEGRVNLTLAVQVVPLNERQKPCVDRVFATVTREFSTSGLSIVVEHPIDFDKTLIGITEGGELYFVRGSVRHQDPLGAGFWHVGLKLHEIIARCDLPELAHLSI